MFSGIVQSMQPIIALSKNQGNLIVKIKKPISLKLKIGDSISVDGVCSTIVKSNNSSFIVEYMPETLKCTSFSTYKVNQKINLETSLKLNDYIHGHLVSGHIDCIGIIQLINTAKKNIIIKIKYPKKFNDYLVEKGSICINGIALTVFNIKKDAFSVGIIPHTFNNTNLLYLKKGDKVNIEFDMIGKYVKKNLSRKI